MSEQEPKLAEPDPSAGGAAILDELSRGATLTDRVYARLRRGLLVGFWAPGEKLSARQIAREMNVSMTPVREAMMRLATEGALEMTETRAFRAPELGRAAYRELVRVRLALEPMAAGLAAARIEPSQVAAIEALNERLAAHLRQDQFHQALEVDSQLHLAIYEAAGQPLLLSIIDGLLLRAGPTRTRLSYAYRKSLAGYEHHRRLIAALRVHDAAAAEAEVAADLEEGAAMILNILPG
ncbi:transcriptional regulator, GntR family [Tistlia consotensis]|uniref:Transcriptional regulator, GntR family n=1 Tax=Tistlia consotensis USBA 355 TaxID=560819 RepID=A0A1Y6CWS3_9PROT|nr:GntR family transcriptional regulator [Tistlia consotensis]SMF82327.1 transcriptional regulator, GntR family [Tistlia consotensis USBA 355]SNS27719.1 transcriptional regulator, GntR family [Tistlia consotensis]